MAIDPKTTREHILALYGYITGVRKDITQIKNNNTFGFMIFYYIFRIFQNFG